MKTQLQILVECLWDKFWLKSAVRGEGGGNKGRYKFLEKLDKQNI